MKKTVCERSEQGFLLVKHPQYGTREAGGRATLPPLLQKDSSSDLMGSFLFVPSEVLLNWDFARNKEFTFEVRYFNF